MEVNQRGNRGCSKSPPRALASGTKRTSTRWRTARTASSRRPATTTRTASTRSATPRCTELGLRPSSKSRTPRMDTREWHHRLSVFQGRIAKWSARWATWPETKGTTWQQPRQARRHRQARRGRHQDPCQGIEGVEVRAPPPGRHARRPRGCGVQPGPHRRGRARRADRSQPARQPRRLLVDLPSLVTASGGDAKDLGSVTSASRSWTARAGRSRSARRRRDRSTKPRTAPDPAAAVGRPGDHLMPATTQTPVRAWAHCTNPRCPGHEQEEVDALEVETSFFFTDNGGTLPGVERSSVILVWADPEQAACRCGRSRDLSGAKRRRYDNLSGFDPDGLLEMQSQGSSSTRASRSRSARRRWPIPSASGSLAEKAALEALAERRRLHGSRASCSASSQGRGHRVVRYVDHATLPPHRCAVLPFVSNSNAKAASSTPGWISTASTSTSRSPKRGSPSPRRSAGPRRSSCGAGGGERPASRPRSTNWRPSSPRRTVQLDAIDYIGRGQMKPYKKSGRPKTKVEA
jgi:hypothetical protein